MLYSDRAQEMQPQESSLNFPFSQLSTSPEYVYQMGGGNAKRKDNSLPFLGLCT